MKKLVKAVMILMMLFSLFSCAVEEDIDIEDGGHFSNTDVNAPKKIESTQLTEIECDYFVEDRENEAFGRYCLSAEKEEDLVKGQYEFKEMDSPLVSVCFPFETDTGFMDKLEEVLRRYDAAQYNGIYEEEIGIDPEYSFSFHATFASGETISCYDNSGPCFPLELMRELADLFYRESGAASYYDTDRLQNLRYSIYDKENDYRFTAYIYEDADGTVRYQVQEKQDDKTVLDRKGETGREILDLIQKTCEENGLLEISEFPRREGNLYCTLEMKNGLEDSRVRSNTSISDEQLEILLGIRDMIKESCGTEK